MLILVAVFGAIWAVLTVYIGVRNELVYRERTRILHRVSELAQKDISERRDWEWRYRAMDGVSYHRMMLEFWKPVRSFYKHREEIM